MMLSLYVNSYCVSEDERVTIKQRNDYHQRYDYCRVIVVYVLCIVIFSCSLIHFK